MQKSIDKKIVKDTKSLFGFSIPFEVYKIDGHGLDDFVPEIDENYVFDPEVTIAICAAFIFNKKELIWGLHGSGKSSHIEQVASRLNWPVLRISLDSQISRMDLIGRDAIKIKDGLQVTEFNEGMLVWAIKNDVAVILDEYDAARPEIMFILQRLLESNGKFVLLEKNMIINPSEFARFFATANTSGSGDEHGIYHGVSFLNQAQMDRWEIVVKHNSLKRETELEILRLRFAELLDSSLIEKFIDYAILTRNAFLLGEVTHFVSTRGVINILSSFLLFKDAKKALEYGFLNRISSDEEVFYSEIYQRVFA